MIYLDNAATTKMFEESAGVYKEYACTNFFNPSAGYGKAVEISKKLDEVRELLKNRLHVVKGDIIFTGGATESNNLAIRGSIRSGKWEYVFSEGEHPSVYNTAKALEQEGHIVHFVPLSKDGQVDYEQLEKVLNEKTRLISIMHVSNETGAINDLKKISFLRDKLCPKALLHVDGVQAFCKIPFSLNDLGIDLYTISAHKFHGPKGVGALYVRNKQGLKNIVFGGGQEGGYRSGTENVPGVMAMAKSCEMIDTERNFEKVKRLNSLFKKTISGVDGIDFVETESPYIISLSFAGVNGETLMRDVQDEVIVGMGSACSTKKAGNRILQSMGFCQDKIKSSLRVSFNAYQTEEDIEYAGEVLVKKYLDLRERVR